ncbi:MAG TPA: helix-turn-helix transcriptional regulator [Nevskiaceae bacterium]|nr:helix-turn-helix transcriptional regulator [Nevskiaceae bacterium]
MPAGTSHTASPSPIRAVDRAIATLYRSARQREPGTYRHWALEQLRGVIPFDGALWGTGAITSKHFHTCTLVGLPEDFPAALEQTVAINPMYNPILAHIDAPVDRRDVLDDAHYYSSPIYLDCFARFAIDHSLSTAHIDQQSGVYSLITLYRHGRDAGFTPAERDEQRQLAFHLVNAASHAFFMHLHATYGLHRQNSAAAVIDRQGLFHQAQAHFFELLDEHFPSRPAHGLPFELPPEGDSVTLGTLCVAVDTLSPELRCIHLWPAGPLDHLTSRERDVVYAVAHGLSFKQAARKLGIAPSTVANHLYRVYRKLQLTGRTQLARLVYPETATDSGAG